MTILTDLNRWVQSRICILETVLYPLMASADRKSAFGSLASGRILSLMRMRSAVLAGSSANRLSFPGPVIRASKVRNRFLECQGAHVDDFLGLAG